jgi:hydrogenase expression/formation protein HypC
MCLAIPAKVVELGPEEEGSALVEVAGVRRFIRTELLSDDPPLPGDWVLVHVGFAMSKISESEALAQIQALETLGEDASAREEAQGYGDAGGMDSDARAAS